MKNDVQWLFRVNGKSFDEWLATRNAAGRQSFDDAAALLAPVNGTRSDVRPTNGGLPYTTPVNGTAINGESSRGTSATKTRVNGTKLRWESAGDQPRVVYWTEPPTKEQRDYMDKTGVVLFIPSSGPDWQGCRGRRPRPDRKPAERKVSDNRTPSRSDAHAEG